jgi:hypothetical protein
MFVDEDEGFREGKFDGLSILFSLYFKHMTLSSKVIVTNNGMQGRLRLKRYCNDKNGERL